MLTTCSICHCWDFTKRTTPHTCPPAWIVWDPENGDVENALTIYTFHADVAAQMWAERDDTESADYLIIGGNTTIVCVQPKEGGSIVKYRVTGQMEPNYSAELVEETP